MAIKQSGLVKSSLPEEWKTVLQSVAAEFGDVVDVEALQVIPLKGAMTNEVYQIKWPTIDGGLFRRVLLRVYGEGVEVFFNRDDEVRTFECMSKHGQGPRLLGRFADGRVEEFIHARVCELLLLDYVFFNCFASFSRHIRTYQNINFNLQLNY